jgi:small subunit ribosomal protein S6
MSVNTYEVTILVRAAAARADFEGTLSAVRATYEVEGAKFTELDKWDERKLAYPIDGEVSALYLNGYFTADPLAIDKIERRAQLGEVILRQLIIARPGKDMERIREQRVKQAAAAAAAAASAASEV